MKKIRISMAFKRLTKAELLIFAARVINKMNSDPQFAKLQPEIAPLSSGFDEFQNLTTAATTVGRMSTVNRAASFSSLVEALDNLAKHVELLVKGNENVILASGFEVARTEKVTKSFSTPFSFEVRKHLDIGSIVFLWEKVPRATNYELQYRKQGETEFAHLLFSSKNKIVVPNLTLGAHLEFRLCAIGTNNSKSNWTNIVSSWIS